MRIFTRKITNTVHRILIVHVQNSRTDRNRSRICEGEGEGEVSFIRLFQASYDDRFEQGLICSSSGNFRIYEISFRSDLSITSVVVVIFLIY